MTFGESDLLDVLRASAGTTTEHLGETYLDATFDELSFDSLVRMDIAGRLHQQYTVSVEADEIGADMTLRALLDLVTARLPGRDESAGTEVGLPPQPFFRVLLRMQLHSGKGAEFEHVWATVGHSVANHPANIAQWLLRAANDPDVYFIVSDWIDEPSFREFESSDEHVEHRARLHPFRAAGTMDTMTAVRHLPGAASADPVIA